MGSFAIGTVAFSFGLAALAIMVSFRTIISCYYSAETGDWTCEVSSDGTEDEANETE